MTFKGELAKTNSRLDEAEARIQGSEKRYLKEQLQARLTDQERCSRRENVRTYGVPEGAEGGHN